MSGCAADGNNLGRLRVAIKTETVLSNRRAHRRTRVPGPRRCSNFSTMHWRSHTVLRSRPTPARPDINSSHLENASCPCVAWSDGRSAWSSLIPAGFSKQRCLCVPATRRLSDDASHLGIDWPPSGQTRRLVQPQGTPFVGKYLCCESCVRGEGGARSGNCSSSHPCRGNRSIPSSEVSESGFIC